MPKRHAAPSPPQYSDSLYQLVDFELWIYGAHKGHETAEIRDVRRTGGGHGLRGEAEKY